MYFGQSIIKAFMTVFIIFSGGNKPVYASNWGVKSAVFDSNNCIYIIDRLIIC